MGEAKKSNDTQSVFDLNMENINLDEVESSTVTEEAYEFASGQQKDVLDAEVLESGSKETGEAEAPESAKVNKAQNKKKKTVFFALTGIVAVSVVFAVVSTIQTNSDNGSLTITGGEEEILEKKPPVPVETQIQAEPEVQPPFIQSDHQTGQVDSISNQAKESATNPLPKPEPKEVVGQNKEAITGSEGSVGTSPDKNAMSTHALAQQSSEPKSKTLPKNELKALIAELSGLRKEMGELKGQIKEQQAKEQPESNTSKRKRHAVPIMGRPIGVVKILNDGVVYKDGSGELHVVKIGQSYKRYGALKSVNPEKNTYITTRGLWRVQ